MELRLEELLKTGAREFDLDITDLQIRHINLYMERLKEKNKIMNLTAITDDEGIIIKHFIDSLSIVPYITEKASMLDIGTGAGFPGIPVKIVRQDTDLTLIDSVGKKINFINEVIDALHMTNVAAIHARAEDLGVSLQYREGFDFVTARAVSALPVLCEYCIPFLKTGGSFIAMKSGADEELSFSRKAIDILGGRLEDVIDFNLPGTDIKRKIIIIKKFRQTPSGYPRKSGKAIKNPI